MTAPSPGPVFSRSFLAYRRRDWAAGRALGPHLQLLSPATAGIETNFLGFPAHSAFLRFLLAALRE